uniref:C2H2-type domain-containing protein n=1 Tax=Clastoptera arizonana TaxID=38151 RepID=A0A1B6CID2_9HEMI
MFRRKKLASFLQTAELLQIKGLTGAASSFKDEHSTTTSDKGPPPLLTPTKSITLPTRKLLPSVSPPPVKRRKGAPVRICKSIDGEGSDTNSNLGADDDSQTTPLKQENIDDNDISRQNSPPDDTFDDEISREGLSFEESPRGEGEADSNDGNATVFPNVGMTDGEEDGEIRREETTLLERSLVAAGVSRPPDMQNPFSSFPVSVPSQGLDQNPPTGSHLAQCGNCPHCGQKYSNQSALKYHVRLMHSDLTNRMCCYLCPRSFTQRESYKTHMWEKHKVRW